MILAIVIMVLFLLGVSPSKQHKRLELVNKVILHNADTCKVKNEKEKG